MDTQRNEFVNITSEQANNEPGRYIPFDIDEEVTLKGYRFRVARVKVGMNELVLKPIGVDRVSR